MRARRLSCAVALALPLLVVAAGCAGTKDAPAASDPTTPSSTATSTAPTQAPSSPAAAPSSTASTDVPLVDRLLPTAQVPGLNAQWRWQDGDTGQPSQDPFGTCAKADLLSIGASDVVARTYFPPDDSDDAAAEQIAEFPDARTAATAWTVLKSWHDRCAHAMDPANGLKVGPMAPVSVQSGTARWYLLSWSPAGEETGRFEAFGMALDGTRIAVLTMDNSGQDRNYPAGKDPMAGMVVAAAGKLS